ncbi:MAG: hypothetical protein ABI668_02835 [Sphingorhabdus sp.]
MVEQAINGSGRQRFLHFGAQFPPLAIIRRPQKTALWNEATARGFNRGQQYWRNKMLKKSIGTSTVAALAALFAVSACNSPAEEAADTTADQMEDTADAVRDTADTQADALEDQADKVDTTTDGVDSAKENSMEDAAQAKREAAEKTADAIEEKADAKREAADK